MSKHTSSSEVNTLATVYVSPPFSPLGQWKGFDQEHTLERCDSVMDLYDQSRRGYAQNIYTTTQEQHQQQHGAGPTTDQFSTPASIHRFRQTATLEGTPDAISSSVRAENDPQLYSFAQGPQYGLVSAPDTQTMHYPTDIQTPATQRAPDSAQYTPYSNATMYSVTPGPSQQQSSQVQYDQSPYRASAPGEATYHQLGMPQSSQYYFSGQAGPPATSTSDFKYTQVSPQYHRSATYGQVGPSTLQPQIDSMLDTSTSILLPTYTQEVAGQVQAPTVDPQAVADRCHALIHSIIGHVHNRSLHEVAGPLIELSQQLSRHVEVLGLTIDDASQRDERHRLWTMINRTWLSALQLQFNVTREMMRTQQARSVIPLHELERLGSELVRLCDDIEKHGLVDYEMGVEEEYIVDLLLKCITLLETPNDRDTDNDTGMAESSASGAARGG